MKIIRLHVENFGRLSDFDLELKDGMNAVLEENGWGKSTLAAFIRVMFYGLEGGRKRELSENDRSKYAPWNQGRFGGSLEFEVKGKRYVVTRDFGKKDKDSTFRLQDAETLLESKDYSERLGEEIFGIDRDSFEKTSFIDRSAIRYHGINSVIGSKVGSVAQSDDLNNYDHAESVMKDYLNANSPKKKLGRLYQIKDEIKGLEQEVKTRGDLDERIGALKQKRDLEREKLGEIARRRDGLQKELAKLAKARTTIMARKRKAELEEALQKRSDAVKAMEESFGGRIPAREELRSLMERVEAAERQQVRLAGMGVRPESERLERLKRYFRNGVPKEQEVQEQIENCNALQDGIQRRKSLEERQFSERQKLEGLALELQRLEVAKELEKGKKREVRSLGVLLGVIILSAGIVLMGLILGLHWNGLLWIPALFLAVAGGGVLAHALLRREPSTETSGEEEAIRLREKECRDHLESLYAELEELSGDLAERERSIQSFLEERNLDYSRADAESMLYEMKGRIGEYRNLLAEQESWEKDRELALEEAKRLSGELEACMNGLGLSAAASGLPAADLGVSAAASGLPAAELGLSAAASGFSVSGAGRSVDSGLHAGVKQWITETLQKLTAYEKEKREEEVSRKELENYLAANPDLEAAIGLEGVSASPEGASASPEGVSASSEGASAVFGADVTEEQIEAWEESVSQELKALTGEESAIHENVSAYNRSLDDAYGEADELREKQEKLEGLKEQWERENERYELVEMTREYLRTSKEQFIARFMHPVKSAFDGYYELMTGKLGAGAEFQIDANVNIYRKEEGEYHDVETQSEGLGDVIGLCIRMALLDVMYEKERPLVIMDDPFASLDQKNLEGAKAFLEKIASNYQLLYLTCHESRA